MTSFNIKQIVFVSVLGLVGCHGGGKDSVSNAVPDGLDPLDESNMADLPGARDGDDYPEELNLVGGQGDDYDWAHGAGYIHASVSDCWSAIQDPEVVVDRQRITSWTVEMDVEPEYDVSFLLHEVSEDIVTVEFDVTWIQGRTAGEEGAPTAVVGRWAKTAGTELVYLLEGSIEFTELEPEVTEISLMEHLDTPGSDETDITAVLQGLFDSITARVHGDPLPTYDD